MQLPQRIQSRTDKTHWETRKREMTTKNGERVSGDIVGAPVMFICCFLRVKLSTAEEKCKRRGTLTPGVIVILYNNKACV